MRFVLCIAVVSLVVNSPTRAADHIWSNKGNAVFLVVGNEGVGKVGPLEIYSPDRSNRVEVTFLDSGSTGDATPVIALYEGKNELELPLHGAPTELEVLWSPDSQSVAVTGSDTSITNWTNVFRLINEKLALVPLDAVKKDMAATYPICEGQKCKI